MNELNRKWSVPYVDECIRNGGREGGREGGRRQQPGRARIQILFKIRSRMHKRGITGRHLTQEANMATGMFPLASDHYDSLQEVL